MRALVTRVTQAQVTSSPGRGGPPEVVGSIDGGLLALVGATHADTPPHARRLADKLWHLRVFADGDGAMNRSCAEVGGAVLVVSQFTLYGDTSRGRRPSFVAAARPEHAEPLVDLLCERLRELGAQVATGRFRTHMQVQSVNDGPVTLLLEV